jgi:hypothetical protein
MKTVKFLKAKSYGGAHHKVGSAIPMRDDHASLLQTLGVVVIEDSPVVKFPIPGRPAPMTTEVEPKPIQPAASILSPKPEAPAQSEQPTGQTQDSEAESATDRTEQSESEAIEEETDSAAPEKEKPAGRSRRNAKSEK